MAYIPNLTPKDKCRCGGGFPPCPPYDTAHGTWIPRVWMTNPPAFMSALERECYEDAKRIDAALKPEVVIYAGLPALYTSIEKEWHDPDKRSALLYRMAHASIDQLKNYWPKEMMSDVEFIRLWAVRLKAYLDLIKDVSHYDLLPSEPVVEDLNSFFTKSF